MGSRTVLVALLSAVLSAPLQQTAPQSLREYHHNVVVINEDGKTPKSARRLAKQLMSNTDWENETQYNCLSKLWYEESRWIYTANNPHSSAYGIAQVLHTSEDSTPQEQILAGFRYIQSRYTEPCAAWQFFQQHHYY